MGEKSTKRRTGKSLRKRSATPIRWSEIPHKQLWIAADDALSLGSRARSSEAAIRHVLKRRLPNLDPADHNRYVELECARIVELLRSVRDEYRHYLEDRGAKPVAEMYWV